jgi:O-antigen/teichoic acid export membrane protein
MSEQFKKLGRHTLVYTAGIVIGRVASFVMLPVYTRFLSPADYGVMELLGMTIDVIGMVAGVGIVTGVFKFYHEEDNPASKKALISTAALAVVALATATTLVGLALAPELSRLIFGALTNLHYLRLYLLLYLLQNFEYVPLLLIRAENRSVVFVTVNSMKLAVMLSLNILFVVYLRMGIEGVLASSIITSAAVAIGLTGFLIRRVGIEFSTEKFRRMLVFGGPLVPWMLGSFVLVFSDRFFLNHYIDTSTVGIYSLAYKFAFLLSVLAYTPFETVWSSQRFEVAKQPDASEIYARVFLYLNVILGGVGLVVALFVRDFLSVMSAPGFLSAYHLVPLLLAAQIVFSWSGYWSLGIVISGRTKVLGTGAVVLVPLTLVLNYLLIPRFGMYGAAWATLVAYTIRFFWIYRFGQVYYPIRYNWASIVKLYGILGTAVAIRFAYRSESMTASISLSVALLLTSIGSVYFLVLSPDDRTAMRNLVGEYFPGAARRAGDTV